MLGHSAARQDGFTLIEIVVVLALFAILLGFGWFVGLEFYQAYALDAERDTLVAVLRKVRSEALRNVGAAPHGLSVASSSYILFSGDSYAARDPALDKEVSRGAGIAAAGLAEVVFGQLAATSSASGTITLSNGVHQRTIELNYEGRISW